MLESQVKKLKYALLIAKYGGAEYFFGEIKRRIYRKSISIGLEKKLDEADFEIKCPVDYSLESICLKLPSSPARVFWGGISP